MKEDLCFLDHLLVSKKYQATELFGPWDFEDSGRIDVAHLRPLLLSVFPAPSIRTQQENPTLAAAAANHLSASQVKRAYEAVTGRPWSPSHPPPTVFKSAKSSYQGLGPVGPTLSEVHAIIDFLCSGEMHVKVGSEIEYERDEPASPSEIVSSNGKGTSSRAYSSSVDGATATHTAVLSGADQRTSDAQVAFLYGSMESIYRTFCLSSVAPGASVPDTLPVDPAHLERIAWSVHAQQLRAGEKHALHRLLVAKGAVAEATMRTPEHALHLTKQEFINFLCSL